MNTEYLKNKKILVVVPHQDDEINIAGGLIYSLHNFSEIIVVFTTNGDFLYDSTIRYKEAVCSLKKLGVKKENVIFLGYCDESYDSKNHMYNQDCIYLSKAGHSKTYGGYGINEYCFNKFGVHNEYIVKNIIKDLKCLISDIMPDVIIGIDLDFHPDHIMTSLCLEKSLGMLFKEKGDYSPIVLKSFAYENSFLGINDFNCEYNYGMKFNVVDDCLVSNPYYKYSERIELDIDKKCYSKNLFANPVWKAINCHKSQLFVQKSFGIINSNCVYWRRNTKNLINHGKIIVSSGNANYLNDFLLCDSSFILNGNKTKINYDKGIWQPEENDKDKKIVISFNDRQYINEIVFYAGRKNNDYIKNVEIKIDDNLCDVIDTNRLVTKYKIEKKVKKITIKVIDELIVNGFSEIELLENEVKKNIYYRPNKNGNSKLLFLFNELMLTTSIYATKIYRKLFLRKFYRKK